MDSLYGPQLLSNKGTQLVDSLLPFFAKLHDSIPDNRKFDTLYRKAIAQHRVERQLELLYSGKGKDGRTYFVITRLEPSLKKDKYSALCASFRRHSDGSPDTSSYQEVFWTWKLKKEELYPKVRLLFKETLAGESLRKYYPQYSNEEYIMFPDERVAYDTINKSWRGGLNLPR